MKEMLAHEYCSKSDCGLSAINIRCIWSIQTYLELGIASEASRVVLPLIVALYDGVVGSDATKPQVPCWTKGLEKRLSSRRLSGQEVAYTGAGFCKVDVFTHPEDPFHDLEWQLRLEVRRCLWSKNLLLLPRLVATLLLATRTTEDDPRFSFPAALTRDPDRGQLHRKDGQEDVLLAICHLGYKGDLELVIIFCAWCRNINGRKFTTS